ncbi:MAG TPA: hypothetical protein PK201_06805 [Accumulibacter sp.]|nr:hypothetical protein [Accumulibacter sp.]
MAAQGGLGDVFLKTRDLAAANDAFTATRRLAEDRIASDPANAEWQRDLIVSYVKLSEVSGDETFVQKALRIARNMQQREILAPRDAWLINELRRRAGQ